MSETNSSRRTGEPKAPEAQVEADLARARKALKAERFDQVVAACERARSRSADARLFNYYPEIDRLRDEALAGSQAAEHVSQVLDRVGELEKAGAVEEALNALDSALAELADLGAQEMGSKAVEKRDLLWGTKSLPSQIDDVRRFFVLQDFRLAYRLVEALQRQYPGHPEVVLWQSRVNRQWDHLQAQLSQANQKLEQGDFQAAVDVLRRMRQIWPQNPDTMRLWMKVYLDFGLDQSEAGRQAIQAGNFDAAVVAFESADQAFQSALEGSPDVMPVRAARDEVAALLQIAISAGQAQNEQRGRHWDAARQTLMAARASLTEARHVREHDFDDVAAVLDAIQTQVDAAIAAIANARDLLTKGQQSLAQGAYDRAQQDFQQGLQLVEQTDEDLAQTLLSGLRQAESRQREIKSLLDEARTASDGVRRLQLLNEVYTRWPGTPGLADLLVGTLLEVAEQASAAGDDAPAIEWCQQVLSLTESETTAEQRAQATALMRKSAARQQVAAWLAEADSLQRQLDHAPLPTAAGYVQLVELLQSAQQDAQPAPDCLPDIEARLQLARDRLERLTQAEALMGDAESLRQRGEWGAAAGQLQAARTVLGDLPAAELSQRQETWQRTASAIESILQTASEALASAQERYRATAADVASSPLAELASRWAEVQGLLASARAALAGPPDNADPLPSVWNSLQATVDDLASRCQVLQDAIDEVRAGRTIEALDRLAGAVDRWPDESVLVPLRDRLLCDATSEARQQARSLLDAANNHIQAGGWGEAQACLTEVEGLQLIADETATERRGLQRRIALWTRIEELFRDGMVAESEMPRDRRLPALYDLLQAAANDDSGLSTQVRGALNALLGLANALLYRDQPQETGARLCDTLAQAALDSRLVQNYVLPTARKWLDLASQQAYESFIFAQIALGEYEQAYAIARQAIDRHPAAMAFLEQADEARQHIQQLLRNSVRVQIARARELQDQGAFAQALGALDAVESTTATLWQHVERDFPEVIREDGDLAELRHEAEALRRTLLDLQALADELTALILQARASYEAGQLQEASSKLAQIRLLDRAERAKSEWQEWQLLHSTVKADLRAATQARVREALDRARMSLDACYTTAEAQQVLVDLDAVRPSALQLDGPDAEALLQNLDETVANAQALLAQLANVGYARQTAAEAAANREFQQQLAALERAAQSARGQELEALKAEIERLRPVAEQQRRMREAWDEARIALDQGDFKAAHDHLAVARQLGMPEETVHAYRETARAGMLLVEARALLGTDAHEVSMHLQKVLELTADCPPAGTVRAEAQEHLTRIENDEQRRVAEEKARAEEMARLQQAQEAQRKQVAALLRSSRSALRKNRLEDVLRDLTEVFALAPEHPEARELWEQLDRAGQANALIERAKELHQLAQYDTALELVQRASAMHPDMMEAQELPVRLTAEREAGMALTRALNLAAAKHFIEARAELHMAWDRNPHHPQLAAAEDQLRELETRYWDAMCHAAEDALGRRDYQTTLRNYTDLAVHLDPTEAQTKITPLRQAAVDQWADWIVEQAHETLQGQVASTASIAALQSNLREALGAEPGPAEDKARTLKALAGELEEARLRRRLAEGYEALRRNDFRRAEAIGHELEEVTASGEWPVLDFLVVKLNEDVKRAQDGRDLGKEAFPPGVGLSEVEIAQEAGLSPEDADALFAETLAALSQFDLDKAERCLAAGREGGATGERWIEADARLQAAQALAPKLREAMAAGWQGLHERDFATAHASFASIANTPSLEEPVRWLQYVHHLQQGVDMVLRLEDEAAAAHLAEAEIMLRIRPGELLPPLGGEQLLDERRRAVFYAQTLREEVTGMITDRRLKDQLKAQNNSAGAADMLRKLIQRQERFPDLVSAVIEPPADFTASVIEAEIASS